MTIPLVVCVLGLIFWVALSGARQPPHWLAILAEAGKWAFMIGLFWTLSAYAGKVAF